MTRVHYDRRENEPQVCSHAGTQPSLRNAKRRRRRKCKNAKTYDCQPMMIENEEDEKDAQKQMNATHGWGREGMLPPGKRGRAEDGGYVRWG